MKKYTLKHNLQYTIKGMSVWGENLIPLQILGILADAAELFAVPVLVRWMIHFLEIKVSWSGILRLLGIYAVILLTVYVIRGLVMNRTKWKMKYVLICFKRELMQTMMSMDYANPEAGRTFYPFLRKITEKNGSLLIFDEIQTYGRIGEFFAADYFDVKPDIIVLGKALGAGQALAAIIIDDKLEGFMPDTEELHTFAHPTLSMVTAAKQIEMLENGVLENCRVQGDYLGSKIREMMAEFPEIGDVRQAGLHIGVEFVDDPVKKNPIEAKAAAIRTAGFKNGLCLGMGGVRKNVLKVKPPLIINRAECDEVLDKFYTSVKEVLR